MGDGSIGKGEIISPMRNVSALCNLYRSVVGLYILHVHVVIHDIFKSWFTIGLNQLKAVPDDNFLPTPTVQLQPPSAITPFTPSLPSLVPLDPDEQLQLPLSKEMALYVKLLLSPTHAILTMITDGSMPCSRHTTSSQR